MTNEEYLDKLGTVKYLLRDQPVDENMAEFYPPESTEHPKCAELRCFTKGRLNLGFIGLITAKSLVSKYAHTYAWFEMGSFGLQDIVRLWGDNNEDDYPQIKKIIGPGIKKIIGPGIGTFMVLVEWSHPVYSGDLKDVFGDLLARDMFGYGTRKDEEVEKHGVKRLSGWLIDHHNFDEGIETVTASKYTQIKDILDIDNPVNTHIKPYSLAEIGKCSDGHYLMLLDGGNNGEAHWHSYLEQIQKFLFNLHNAGYDTWIVEIKNDCLDDTHQVILGLQEQDVNQCFEFDVSYPDGYMDLVATYLDGWCFRQCHASHTEVHKKADSNKLWVLLSYAPGEWHLQSSLNAEFNQLGIELKKLFGDKVSVSVLKEVLSDGFKHAKF